LPSPVRWARLSPSPRSSSARCSCSEPSSCDATRHLSARSDCSRSRTPTSRSCSRPLPSTPSSPDAPPRRRWLLAVVALAVVLVVAGLTTIVLLDTDSDSSSVRPTPDGSTCAVGAEPAASDDERPVFQVPGLHGGCIDLADFRGRPVLLNFWASYCTPCRDEFPLLKQARQKHRDDDLAIIGVSFRDIDDDAR